MKKIIATVLAMVMALALCTTAFAAVNTPDAKLYHLDDNKAVIYTDNGEDAGVEVKHYDAKEYNDAGNVEYWVGQWANKYVYVECAQKDATHAIAVKQGFATYVKETKIEGTVTVECVVNYVDVVTKQDKTTEKASCTTPHYLVDGYLDGEGNFYTAGTTGTINVKIYGTQTIVAVNKMTAADANVKVVYASCVLGEAKKNADKGWY